MQVTQTSAEGLKRELTVTVAADEIEGKITEKLNEVGRQIRLPGFRPGKAPISLLKKRFGQAVRGEVLEETVNTTSQQALNDNEIRPASQPQIEVTKFDEGEPLEYKIAVEVMPQFEAMDFSKIKLERLVAKVDDETVDDALGRMAQEQKKYEPVAKNRKAKEGDAVLIDFVGKVDGEAFQGGTANDHQLVLGSGSFIPGFEEQVVGAKGGDEIKVEVTFPEEYGAKELAGKQAVFDVTVKEVREAQDVPLDDDFAAQLGLENLEALRNAMRDRFRQDYEQFTRQRLKRELLDVLADNHDFDVPPGMVDQEFEQIWHQFQHELEHANQTVADLDKPEEELREEYRQIAERRVRLGLLLSEVGRENNIAVSQEEINRAIMQQAQRYPGQEQMIFEYFQKNPEAQSQIRAPIFEDKVIDFVLEMAELTDREVPVEELMRDPDEEEAPAEASKSKKASGGARKSTAKKAESKSAAQSAGKSSSKDTASKSASKSEAKSASKSASKSEAKSDTKSASKSGTKSSSKAGSKASGAAKSASSKSGSAAKGGASK